MFCSCLNPHWQTPMGSPVAVQAGLTETRTLPGGTAVDCGRS